MRPVVTIAVLSLTACGATPTPEPVVNTVALSQPPAPAPAESPDCRAERLAILDAVTESQAKPCAANAECATATNPGSFVHEFDVVVNAADREAIEARSQAHLDSCGAFIHYEPIDAIRVVEAACADGQCRENETVLHVGE